MAKAKTIIATLLITAMFLMALPTIPVKTNSIAEGPWTPVLSDPEELGGWADLKALYAKMDEGNLTFKVEYYGNMSDWGEGLGDFRLSYIMLDADQDNTTGYTTPQFGGIGIDYLMYYYWGFQLSPGMPPEWGPVWCMLLRWSEAISNWEGVMMLGVSTPRNDTAYITAPLESLGYSTAVDVFVWAGIMGDGGQGPPMGNFMDMIIQTWNYTSGIDPHSITVDGDSTDWPVISPSVTDLEDRDTYRFIDVTDFYMTDNSTQFFFRVDTTLPPVTTLQNESAELVYQHIIAFDVDQDNTTGSKDGFIGLDAALLAGVRVNSSIGWEDYTQGMLWYPNGTMYDVPFTFDVAIKEGGVCEFSVPMNQINEVNGTGIDGLFYASTGLFYDWMPQEGYGTFMLPPYLIVDVRATLSWWDTAVVTAGVTNQTIPILDASVKANVTLPDDTVLGPIALYDDGTHGDPVAGDANYTNTFPITQMGYYRVNVYAIKDTVDGTGYQTLRTISPQDAASFIASCQNPDGGFSERDVKTTGLAVEALSSLLALGQINGTKTIDWIAGHQQPGGDFGAPYRTYWAVKALQILGGLGDIDKDATINSLVNQQRLRDVGPEEYGGWGDLHETCRAIIALKTLGGLGHPDLNLTAAKEFIKGRQNPDGGFCNWPGQESWMQETYNAVGALKTLNATAEIIQAQAIAWLASCQRPEEGDFCWRPGEGSDVEPTYMALQALQDLGGLGSVNSTKAGEWLVGCQRSDGGFNNPWKTLSDEERTCWAIKALEVLGNLSLINRDEAVQFIMSYYDLLAGCFRRDTDVLKTLDAIEALCLLGALNEIDWRAAADYLAGCQFPDGGFCSDPSQGNPDVSSTYYAVFALDLVGRLDTINTTRAIYYLVVRQNPEGGFVNWYGEEPDIARTSHAVRALNVLGGLDKINIDQAIAWLASCQNPDGGFGWRPGEGESQPLRTYWAVSALEVLGGLGDINVTSVIEYLKPQQNPWNGDFWGSVAQTYAALHTLSILGALDSIDAKLAANYLIGCQNPDGGFGEWGRDPWSFIESTDCSILGLQLVFGLPAVDIDTTPPTITTPTQVPATDVMPYQDVTISVNVTDASGVQNVTLWYKINGGEWILVNMTSESGDTYTGEIPGQPIGTNIQYKIIAYDKADNMAVEEYEFRYYVYTVIPEFPLTMLLPLLMFATLAAVMLAKNRRQEKP